jgi:hypothetical protein
MDDALEIESDGGIIERLEGKHALGIDPPKLVIEM